MKTLREYVEGKAPGAGGASGGSSSPISLKALDIEQDIREVARLFYEQAGGEGEYDLAAMITHWYLHGDKESCELWARFWVDQIKNLGRRKMDLIGSCPECGESAIVEQDEAGQGVVKKVALVLCLSEAFAECRQCGIRWEGQQELLKLAMYIKAE